MVSRIGRTYRISPSWSSDIGKWPRPSITAIVDPAICVAAACVQGTVGKSYSPVKQVDGAAGRVDLVGLAAQVVLDGVVVDVAAEDARRALGVVQARLVAVRLGRRGRHDHHHRGGVAGRVGVGERGRFDVAEIDRDVGVQAALEGDHGAVVVGVVAGQVECQHPADRRADEDRPVEAEHGGERGRQRHGELLGQHVRLGPPGPAGGWERLAVEREVVDDDLEAVGDAVVLEQVAPLASVGAGGVLAEQADALAGASRSRCGGRARRAGGGRSARLRRRARRGRPRPAPERGPGRCRWRRGGAARRSGGRRGAGRRRSGGGSTVIAPTPAAAKGSV